MAKALVVAAPNSCSGKTIVTLGLLRAFRNKGIRVASAKIGPDYIDPRFHSQASGRECFNIDPWAMGKGLIASILSGLSRDTDLILIEGVMGLFDGPHGARGSTADLAEDFGFPVLLVVDVARQSQSIVALVHGFRTYRPQVKVAGVFLNRLAGDRHLLILQEALGKAPLGILRHSDSLAWPSRHLGLLQAEENQKLEEFIEFAASAVARETNLDILLTSAAQVSDESVIRESIPPLGQKIAVARDRAFSFAYPHLLRDWQRAGAEITLFSPLADESPDARADAIFLPGGYPELYAGKLSANNRFLAGLKGAKGLIYGECGGYMVLGDALVDDRGDRHSMAGLLPLTTSFAKRKLHIGYRQLSPATRLPWQKSLRGHEFHYSTVVNEGPGEPLFFASDAAGNQLPNMGLRRGSVMGSYAHVICEAP